MKCKDCTNWGCLRRTSDAEKDCYYEEKEKISYQEMFDWQSFRAEAAKDILCATLSGGISSGATGILEKKELIVEGSIELADELIKQLKEKEVRNEQIAKKFRSCVWRKICKGRCKNKNVVHCRG